jgi:hypothetical protein
MKAKMLISISLILLMISFGCKKSEDPAPETDMATKVSGIYTGTYSVMGQQVSGTCEVKKASAATVTFTVTISGQPTPPSPAITISGGANSTYTFSYIESGDTMNGTFSGKTLTFTMVSGSYTVVFTGAKP